MATDKRYAVTFCAEINCLGKKTPRFLFPLFKSGCYLLSATSLKSSPLSAPTLRFFVFPSIHSRLQLLLRALSLLCRLPLRIPILSSRPLVAAAVISSHAPELNSRSVALCLYLQFLRVLKSSHADACPPDPRCRRLPLHDCIGCASVENGQHPPPAPCLLARAAIALAPPCGSCSRIWRRSMRSVRPRSVPRAPSASLNICANLVNSDGRCGSF